MNKKDAMIHIIDDDLEICKALRWLFESIELKVAIYENPVNFLNIYNRSLSGCIILDIRMPSITGLEVLDKLKILNNTLPIIMISGYADIPMAVRAIKAGAIEFFVKPFDDKRLLETVVKYINQTSHAHGISNRAILLTPREQEIMNLIIAEKYNKEIASDLNISISTIEAHRSRIMDKFQAKNVAQLIKKYYQIS